ncbi:MAG: hypothetical protein QW607_08120 [Desulfurococcaceae archaeon]
MTVEIGRTLAFTKNLVFGGRVLSKSLTLNKSWETRTAYVLSRPLTLNKSWEVRTAYVLLKSLAVNKTFPNNIEKSLITNLPLDQTSQVWIEKTDGSVDSIEPLIVFLRGEPALICDAVNPKLLIGLTDDFDIVFAYKPKNVLPNQKYRFVIKRG